MKLTYLFIRNWGIGVFDNSGDICFYLGHIIVGIPKGFIVLNSSPCLIGFVP